MINKLIKVNKAVFGPLKHRAINLEIRFKVFLFFISEGSKLIFSNEKKNQKTSSCNEEKDCIIILWKSWSIVFFTKTFSSQWVKFISITSELFWTLYSVLVDVECSQVVLFIFSITLFSHPMQKVQVDFSILVCWEIRMVFEFYFMSALI